MVWMSVPVAASLIWMLRAIPFVYTIMSTSMRVSNAKARRELGWTPTVPTYREGIALVAKASG